MQLQRNKDNVVIYLIFHIIITLLSSYLPILNKNMLLSIVSLKMERQLNT